MKRSGVLSRQKRDDCSKPHSHSRRPLVFELKAEVDRGGVSSGTDPGDVTVIAPRAGVAILAAAGSYHLMRAGSGTNVQPCESADIAFLLGDCAGLVSLPTTNRRVVARSLELAVNQQKALDLFLLLLDGEMPCALRRRSAIELEPLQRDNEVALFVEGLLCARPLVGAADTQGAVQAAEQTGSRAVLDAVRALERLQPFVSAVRSAWDAIDAALFGDQQLRRASEALLVREGLFAKLANVLAIGTGIDWFLFDAIFGSQLEALERRENIVLAWVRPLLAARPSVEWCAGPRAAATRWHGLATGEQATVVHDETTIRSMEIPIIEHASASGPESSVSLNDLLQQGRPKTRGQCQGQYEFCPWVGCRHHLYLEVGPTGSIKYNFPHLEVWEMPWTCSLDVADSYRGLEEKVVADLLHTSTRSVKQCVKAASKRLSWVPWRVSA